MYYPLVLKIIYSILFRIDTETDYRYKGVIMIIYSFIIQKELCKEIKTLVVGINNKLMNKIFKQLNGGYEG